MMERNEGEQLWWALTWVITGLWCLFMCMGCASHSARGSHVASSDNLTIVDLSGVEVNAEELAEFVRVFGEEWERTGLSRADVVLASLKRDPVIGYFPPTDYISCPHIQEETQYGVCIGFTSVAKTSIFVARPRGEPIGCGALAHELAHVMLSRMYSNIDGKHNKFEHVWKFGGMLDQVKIKLGCEIEPQNLRVWK